MRTSGSQRVTRNGARVAAAVMGLVLLAAASAWAVAQNDIGAEGIARGAPDTNASAASEDQEVLLRLAFDEGTGTVASATGSLARQCAIENGEWVKDGMDGSCLKVSGIDSSVNLGEIKLSAPFTFSCWLSPGAELTDMRLVSGKQAASGLSWGLTLNYPEAGIISQWDGKKWCIVDPPLPLSDWKWVWLVVAVDAKGKATLYCNGLRIGATVLATQSFDPNRYFFGTKFHTYGACYKGLVDEIVFRNRTLTAAEIQETYDGECKRLKREVGAAGPINPRKAPSEKLSRTVQTTNAEDPGPFIRVREVVSATPWGDWIKSEMPPELRHQYLLPFWPDARLRRHLEMLKAFGFNSIQVGASPCLAWWVGADEQEVRKKVLFRCRTARELGLSVSGFIWGAAVPDAMKGGAQFSELDWHKPEDRARLLAWYRDQAEIAPFIDRLVTHWIDPGYNHLSCGECTIDTVVEMHNVILGIYREKNPNIRGALSTWFMGPTHGPKGYEGPRRLAEHPKLDRNTDIACGIGAGPDLDAILAKGRKIARWTWYNTDNEIQPALHVMIRAFSSRLSLAQRRAAAPVTTEALAWVSVPDNFSGLNMQNLYVAGKLMQDPTLDERHLLDEFARGLVGAENASALVSALRAVEAARTRSNCYYAKIVDAVAPPPELQSRHQLPAFWLDDTSQAVDAAISGMKHVKLAPDFKTAWPVAMEPAEYLGELNAHLEAIRQMLAFLKGAREVKRMKAEGAPVEKLEAAIAALPKVIYDPAHTAGLEAGVYKQKLAELKRTAGAK